MKAEEPYTGRPLPVPDQLSAPYWEALASHQLTLARCSRCGRLALPPDVACSHCLSSDPCFAFVAVSGHGTVRSWTVLHDSFLPGFEDELPLVLVDVELDEQPGLRLIGRLLDAEVELRAGMRVTGAFEDLVPGVSVPAFTSGRPP